MKNMISMNLLYLRDKIGYTQELIAEKVGVTRQAVSRWESGETLPDINSLSVLSELFHVSIDDFVRQDFSTLSELPPKGKYVFGLVTVGNRGQIVIPKKARDIFSINAGDSLLVLGDENQGIAVVKSSDFLEFQNQILKYKL